MASAFEKLELYAYDSSGKRIPKRARGIYEVTCRPTRSYYDVGTAAEEAESAGRMHAAIDGLTDEERECLMLHEARGVDLDRILRERMTPEAVTDLLGRTRTRVEKREIPLADEEEMIAAGWSLVTRNARRAVVTKAFPVHLGYDQIARVVGLTPSQARARVLSAHRKLREAAARESPE